MVISQASKRTKPSENMNTDRISDLPDSLILQILSLLPTENAVATSILSKRWKFLWTSLTSLNFDEQTIISRPNKNISQKRMKFTIFVNRVFLLITPPFIQKFRLSCSHKLFDPSNLDLWISVIARTVKELDFDLLLRKEVMRFYLNHFHFDNLVVLKLKGITSFNINANFSVCLPSLKSLYLIWTEFDMGSNVSLSFPKLVSLKLDGVKFRQEDSVQKLFTSCPILDFLDMRMGDEWKNTLVVRIPSLTKLCLCAYHDNAFGIRIYAIQKLKFMWIFDHSLKSLVTETTNISLDFHGLRELTLDVPDCHEWSFVIKNMLGNMDNLKHLVLMRWKRCSCAQKSWWAEPLIMPKCLQSRVTYILFEIMNDCQDDLEMVKYFLKNAKVLRVLKLSTSETCSSERKLQLVEEISMIPKRSKACQIKFT